MAERVLKCPQCSAPLSPGRFARQVTCGFCGASVQVDPTAVSAARFQEAWRTWNDPAHHGFTSWWSLGDSHWAPGPCIARGEVSDVYTGQRARWPTERVLLKVLRDPDGEALLAHEAEVLARLQESTANGAETFTTRLPQPVAQGVLTGGALAGRPVLILRWPSGFVHTFEAVRAAWPSGVDPRVAVWMWRRLLETLSFLHRSGLVHGAVLPPHLLVQHGDHGARLVGFSCADRVGAPLRAVATRFEGFYPEELLRSRRLTPAADLEMSARCIAEVLGGDGARGTVPASVPAPLAELVRSVAHGEGIWERGDRAWTLRGRVGEVGHAAFGRPSFHPLEMP